MFAEELAKIKESEAQADALQKKAKTDAKQALADAKSRAEQLVEDAQARGREIYDALLKEGQDISDQQYNSFLEATRRECDAMVVKARSNEDKVITLIAERIVSASVNR